MCGATPTRTHGCGASPQVALLGCCSAHSRGTVCERGRASWRLASQKLPGTPCQSVCPCSWSQKSSSQARCWWGRGDCGRRGSIRSAVGGLWDKRATLDARWIEARPTLDFRNETDILGDASRRVNPTHHERVWGLADVCSPRTSLCCHPGAGQVALQGVGRTGSVFHISSTGMDGVDGLLFFSSGSAHVTHLFLSDSAYVTSRCKRRNRGWPEPVQMFSAKSPWWCVGSIQGRSSLQVESPRAHFRRAVTKPSGEIAVVGVSAEAGVQNRQPSRVLRFLSYAPHSVMEKRSKLLDHEIVETKFR